MQETIKCSNQCCTLQIEPYIEKQKDHIRKGNCKKSGICLFDPESEKILLVMSKGNLWGIPKGSLEMDKFESYEEGALRELEEETGIFMNKEELFFNTNVTPNALYFYSEMKEIEVKVQNMDNNDANGIGWIKLKCLEDLIKKEIISLNYHTKIILRNFFGRKWNFGLR
jgi:ADP-ribose pyrophosphatase YjhB (NUDIX family)